MGSNKNTFYLQISETLVMQQMIHHTEKRPILKALKKCGT